MIEVRGLVKRYGDHLAVNDVSFSVARGEVVGLLGPNGAGKSTVMRVVAGYLSATAGGVTVDGIDVAERSLEARARVGYLPESGPVYLEMRVEEYLDWRIDLRAVPRDKRRKRMDAALAACDLGEVRHRIVGQLSKGFRQRVAVAGTLVHDPRVVILDEPTSGLDPLQIREMRALVRRLGRKRTVLYSTHILSEAEAVCDRVVILHRGRVLADAVPAEITARVASQVLSVEVVGDAARLDRALSEFPTWSVERLGPPGATQRLLLAAPGIAAIEARQRLSSALTQAGVTLVELAPVRTTLDEAFARLTSEPPP